MFKVGVDTEISVSVVDDATHKAVVESNLEDLLVLASEIESQDVYSITPETLRMWAFKLKNTQEILEKHASGDPVKDSTFRPRSPSRFSNGGAAVVGGATPGGQQIQPTIRVKRESLGRPRSEGLSAQNGDLFLPSTVAGHVASTVHMLLDTLCHITHAEWSVCYIYVESIRKMVMIGGAGKRQGKPGDVKLHTHAGVEHLVLENGVGVCMQLATAEKEFSDEQDKVFADHTKSMIVFPLLKPGAPSCTLGVIEVGNRTKDGPFTVDEEAAVADCGFFISHLISRFPNDVTNPNTLDSSIFSKPRESERAGVASASRPAQLVFRTSQQSAPRKAEMLRDALALPRNPTIESALDHIAQIGEAWKSAVLLNIELEHEIRRLHEALRISRRDTARLQEVVGSR